MIARLDIVPPPTGVIDVLYLGPAGVAVGLALLGACVALFVKLRRSGRSRLKATALAAVLFVAGNLLSYWAHVAFFWRSPSRDRVVPPPPPALSASARMDLRLLALVWTDGAGR